MKEIGHQSTKPTVYLQPYNPAIEDVSLILGHTKFPIPAGANLFKSPPPMYSQSLRHSVTRPIPILVRRMIRLLHCLNPPPSNGHLNNEIYESESAFPREPLLGLLDSSLPIRLGYYFYFSAKAVPGLKARGIFFLPLLLIGLFPRVPERFFFKKRGGRGR